jgi:hypothetical protein
MRDTATFSYTASDAGGASAPAQVRIAIEPPNRPPVITSTPPTAVAAVRDPIGNQYPDVIYRVAAYDPDPGDSVHFELAYPTPTPANFPFFGIDASTGAVRMSTGPCGSFGGPCEWGPTTFVVAAVDSFGARAEQSFVVDISAQLRAVPDVVGTTEDDARMALGNAGLLARVDTAFDAHPAGTVIAQDPGAGAPNVTRNATVALTVSKGPAPVVVPLVAGNAITFADTRLAALGLARQVTYAYADQPAGTVLDQSPPAGTEVVPVPANPVALTVSAGPGVAVRLRRNYTTADAPVAFDVVAIDLAGHETPLVGATLALTALPPTAGSPPSVAAGTIVPAADTRGVYRLTATDDVHHRSASADLVVVQPASPTANFDVAAFARLDETMNGVADLLRQARLTNDLPTATARVKDAVALWRGFDQRMLRLSSPFAVPHGVPPRVIDLPAGMTASDADRLNLGTLEDLVAAVEALVEAQRDPHATVAQLAGKTARIASLEAILAGMTPGEYGLVQAQPEYAALLAHLLPDAMDALMDDLGATVGLSPAPTPYASTKSRRAARHGASAKSTLAELAVTQALAQVTDQLDVLGRLRQDAMKQAAQGAMLVTLASHLRAALHGESLVEVVGGASLSFRLFKQPYSFIEGSGLEAKYPYLNEVVMLGPDVVAGIPGIASTIANADLSSLFSAAKLIYDVQSQASSLASTAEDALVAGSMRTHAANTGCVFSAAPDCVQLLFEGSGFYPVYQYTPGPPFASGLSGIPVPVIVIVRNSVSGDFLFATPAFIPYNPQAPD